jgi:hypothetical protein
MFTSELPNNCPPKEAFSSEKVLFRIFIDGEISEKEFIPYVVLYPDNKRYKKLCIAYSLSFYNDFNNAKNAYNDALKRNKKLGKFIAKLKINKKLGKFFTKDGKHYSFWIYNYRSISEIECLEMSEIE